MKVLYGISTKNIDVTDICLEKLVINNILYIPSGDENRSTYFTDPVYGILKEIVIITDDGDTMNFDASKSIIYDLKKNTSKNKLQKIQEELKLDFGSFKDEFDEQMMSVMFLTGDEKVLEIGANIGRNTLIISSLLKLQTNLVSMECNMDIANQLIYNKNINKMNFFVEKSALSKRKLIQTGWDTIPNEELIDGYKEVDIINWEQLNIKYNIQFDTLVLDCEGAFYYILMDMPEILDNIKLIITENDYHDITQKNFIDNILKQNNFKTIYSKSGGWGPCYNNFYEVWKKTT